MLDRLLEVYGDILVDELEEEIYEDDGYNISYHQPSQGGIHGLTWFNETEPIGKELMNEFLEATEEYCYTCEQINKLAQGNIYNFVAWFMWDYLISTYKKEVIEYVKEHSNLFIEGSDYV